MALAVISVPLILELLCCIFTATARISEPIIYAWNYKRKVRCYSGYPVCTKLMRRYFSVRAELVHYYRFTWCFHGGI